MSVDESYSDQEEDFQTPGDKVVKIIEKDTGNKTNKKNKSGSKKQYDVIEAGNFAIIPSVEEKKKRAVKIF